MICVDTDFRFFAPPSWALAASQFKPACLPPRTIQIWAFSLQCDSASVEAFGRVLSSEELSQANRFLRDCDREDYVVSHGIARFILARYCNVLPSHMTIMNGDYGKPKVIPYDTHAITPFFNMTHSHGRMLLAAAVDGDVGIDLEFERDNIDFLRISRRVFAGTDLASVVSADPRERCAAFYSAWVCNEAASKARGTGIGTAAASSRDVRFTPDHSVMFAQYAPGVEASLPVQVLDCGRGWHAAISAMSKDWDWQVYAIFNNHKDMSGFA